MVVHAGCLAHPVDQGVGPLLEKRSICRRNTEHLGDHDDGKRIGKSFHDVEALALVHGSEQLVDDLPHPGLELGDRSWRERLLHDATKTFVIRRIGEEHRRGSTEGIDPIGGHLGDADRGEHGRVLQDLQRVVVAGDHPGAEEIVAHDGAKSAELVVVRNRIGDDRGVEEVQVHCPAHASARHPGTSNTRTPSWTVTNKYPHT